MSSQTILPTTCIKTSSTPGSLLALSVTSSGWILNLCSDIHGCSLPVSGGARGMMVRPILTTDQLWSHWSHHWPPLVSASSSVKGGISIHHLTVIFYYKALSAFQCWPKSWESHVPCQLSNHQYTSSLLQHYLRSFEGFCFHFKHMSIDVYWNPDAEWSPAHFHILAPLQLVTWGAFASKPVLIKSFHMKCNSPFLGGKE